MAKNNNADNKSKTGRRKTTAGTRQTGKRGVGTSRRK